MHLADNSAQHSFVHSCTGHLSFLGARPRLAPFAGKCKAGSDAQHAARWMGAFWTDACKLDVGNGSSSNIPSGTQLRERFESVLKDIDIAVSTRPEPFVAHSGGLQAFCPCDEVVTRYSLPHANTRAGCLSSANVSDDTEELHMGLSFAPGTGPQVRACERQRYDAMQRRLPTANGPQHANPEYLLPFAGPTPLDRNQAHRGGYDPDSHALQAHTCPDRLLQALLAAARPTSPTKSNASAFSSGAGAPVDDNVLVCEDLPRLPRWQPAPARAEVELASDRLRSLEAFALLRRQGQPGCHPPTSSLSLLTRFLV